MKQQSTCLGKAGKTELVLTQKDKRVSQKVHLLGTQVQQKLGNKQKMQLRIVVANRSTYALGKVLPSKILSRSMKIKVYKIILCPMLIYACETWILDKSSENMIAAQERRICEANKVRNKNKPAAKYKCN